MQTSSPSMDISKASNFERFVFDLVERDPDRVRGLWRDIDHDGDMNLAATPYFARIPDFGFRSSRSTHADRVTTIRRVHADFGVVVDTHTADGIKGALEQREAGIPMVCLETAQPAKFADTVREALGRDPERPSRYHGLEALPQRFEVIDPDATAVMHYIATHAA